jgi:hypothetical protein
MYSASPCEINQPPYGKCREASHGCLGAFSSRLYPLALYMFKSAHGTRWRGKVQGGIEDQELKLHGLKQGTARR